MGITYHHQGCHRNKCDRKMVRLFLVLRDRYASTFSRRMFCFLLGRNMVPFWVHVAFQRNLNKNLEWYENQRRVIFNEDDEAF